MKRNSVPNKYLMTLLIAVFTLNQFLIQGVTKTMGMTHGTMLSLFAVKQANAMEIMMPVPDAGGMVTHLQMMPTITEVVAEPNTGDTVADAKAVMIASGMPFYAPDGISFDDPIGALDAWGSYETLQLAPDMEERYQRLISIFPCNFCCGSPTSVTLNGRCGCAHSAAARGFFRYMLNTYGSTYSIDQLFGEAYRWQAIWYPSGVVEDYLLATGRGDVLIHKTHGGAGTDGMHGITQ